MDNIPIFSGKKKDLDSWVTCGHFISAIENFVVHCSNFTELEIKELASRYTNNCGKFISN